MNKTNVEINKKYDSMDKPIYLKNKELNTLEIAERKIILESKPIILGLIITTRCNLNCFMCARSNNGSGNTLARSAFENILEVLPYLIKIDWQGGEIFYVDYLKETFRMLIPY